MPKKNVLIIDDEPDICELIEITLMRMGFQTQSAYTVAEAYSLLKKNTYDLFVGFNCFFFIDFN